MKQTLLKIQELVDDIRSDVTLFNLTPTMKKVEKALQLLEGVIGEVKENDKK